MPPGTRFADSTHEYIKATVTKYRGEVAQTIEKVRVLTVIAESIGATMSQFSLAWCLETRNNSSMIIRTSRSEQIDEDVGALQAITEELMRKV